jgi:carbonic anhydrase
MESLPYSADLPVQPAPSYQSILSSADYPLQNPLEQSRSTEKQSSQPAAERLQDGSASINAETVLQILLDGSIRFSAGKSQHPHMDKDRLITISDNPSPIALIIACSDARVPPEIVLDQGLGDIFTIRTAGMALSSLDLATIGYAINRWSIPLILVLGHTKCAAVYEALSIKQKTNFLEPVLSIIRPGLKSAALQPGNAQDNAILANIQRTADQILLAYPQWQNRVSGKENMIAAALYDVEIGTVQLIKLNSSPLKVPQTISAEQKTTASEHAQTPTATHAAAIPAMEVPTPPKFTGQVPQAYQKWCPRCLQGYMPNIRFCSLCGIPLVGPDARIQCPHCRQVNVISADSCWSCMKPLHNNIDPSTGKMKPSTPNQLEARPLTSCSSTSVFIAIIIFIVMMLILHHS